MRIPVYSRSEKAKRIEYRPPDPSCNGYLAFAALLMAGLDGIQNKILPPDPIDRNLYDLEPQEALAVKSTPGSLTEVLNALEENHEFLLKGDVFTMDVIDTWLNYKRTVEVDQVRTRPHQPPGGRSFHPEANAQIPGCTRHLGHQVQLIQRVDLDESHPLFRGFFHDVPRVSGAIQDDTCGRKSRSQGEVEFVPTGHLGVVALVIDLDVKTHL